MSARPDECESEQDRLLRLVRKAMSNYQTTPCFEWEETARQTASNRCFGIEARELKRLAVKHVLRDGGRIGIVQEKDEEWLGKRRFGYWFKVCFPVEDAGEVFMKIALVNDDEDYPEARIVGAHESL